MLLVLDNFEQVVGAAASVAELLRGRAGAQGARHEPGACSSLSVEHEYPGCAPRATGPGQLPAEHLSQYDGGRLFVERAQAVQPDFALTDANAAGRGRDLRAAGRAAAGDRAGRGAQQAAGARGVAAAARPPLQLLTGGARDLPARQQTLRATIDWSYELLSDAEQRLFRAWRLRGGWTLEAAEAVCVPPASWHRRAGRGGVARRQEPGVAHAPAGPASRAFGMLETIREYARERLQPSGEEAGAAVAAMRRIT